MPPKGKAMIVSVGRTPEPIAETIARGRPKFVCFFASQQSLEEIPRALELLRQKKPNIRFDNYKVVVDREDDLEHCYRKALECADKVSELNYPPDKVIVDYTGGTKTITAALALATVNRGFSFSAVGGQRKGPTVVTGKEKVFLKEDPWKLFAVEERRHLMNEWNAFHFGAARRVAGQIAARLSYPESHLFQTVAGLAEAYRVWDVFDHKAALKSLGEESKKLDELGQHFKYVRDFGKRVKENLAFLRRMAGETNGFKQLGHATVADLLSNARRRAFEHKHDDAVARVYRAVEMIGQVAFLDKFKTDTGKVKPEALPEDLREEYTNKYFDSRSGVIKLGLHATFRALARVEHAAGRRYMDKQDDLSNLLSARNGSILAHGTASVKPETFEKFHALVRDTFRVKEEITFPGIDWW